MTAEGTAPAKPGGKWAAVARFGQYDQITAESAAGLLEGVRPLQGEQDSRGRSAVTRDESAVEEISREYPAPGHSPATAGTTPSPPAPSPQHPIHMKRRGQASGSFSQGARP